MNIGQLIAQRKQQAQQRREEARNINEQIRKAKVEAHKQQQIRLAQESERIKVSRELERQRKFGSGISGRIKEGLSGYSKYKKNKNKSNMGLRNVSLGSSLETGLVNRGAFELGGSGGNRNIFDLGPARTERRPPRRKQRGKQILIQL